MPSDQKILRNLPVNFDDLLAHRSWNRRELHHLLKKADHGGYAELAENGKVCLSESGFGEAARVTRNHRLWELFLIRYADIAPSHVDRGADFVEHVLGPDIVRILEDELNQTGPILKVPPSPHAIETPQSGNVSLDQDIKMTATGSAQGKTTDNNG